MKRWHAKIGACIGVFLIPLVCTLLPVKVAAIFDKKGEKGKKVLSCLMCFGGGVFFSTYMLHMGPEVRDIIDVALIKPYNIVYPVADLIMAFGFFLVMFMEKAVIFINQKKKASEEINRQKACQRLNQPYIAIGVNSASGTNPSMQLPDSFATSDPKNTCPLRGTGDCCEDPTELKMQMTAAENVRIVNYEGEKMLEVPI